VLPSEEKAPLYNEGDQQSIRKDGNLDHYWCECEVLVTIRHVSLGSFVLDAENDRGKSRTLLE
jgi:hypothetical protein